MPPFRQAQARIVPDVHLNPHAGHHEIWQRDLDGYLVVLTEAHRNPFRPGGTRWWLAVLSCRWRG